MNKSMSDYGFNGSEVAVIGMAGRFPGASNVSEFWRNLRDGVESIVTVSEQDLKVGGIDEATLRDPNFVRAHGVLQDKEQFDPGFFGLSQRDAAIMDPQHLRIR